jgi:hypothetical protein
MNTENIAFSKSYVNVKDVDAVALGYIEELLELWLHEGKPISGCWDRVRNPTRDDRNPGSFKIRLSDGYWTDYARPDDWGTGLVSLYALSSGLNLS